MSAAEDTVDAVERDASGFRAIERRPVEDYIAKGSPATAAEGARAAEMHAAGWSASDAALAARCAERDEPDPEQDDALRVGDLVEVVGPSYVGSAGLMGVTREVLADWGNGDYTVSKAGVFPRSSLRRIDQPERDEGRVIALDNVTREMMWTELVCARASMRSIAATLGDSMQARLLADAVREIDELIGPAQAASS